MKKYIYSIVAATALFTSCSQDAELNEIGNTDPKAITTIGASTEISTRAVVSSADNTKVLWQDGDQLGVLGTNGSSNAKNLAYTLDGVGGSTTGTFKNESSDITAISAVMYPYQTTASWDGANSKLTCKIPSVQTATVNSFDKTAAVMYSIGNTTNVKLNYAVNFLKVTVSESETNVHAISISSTTTALSGKMEITTSSGVTAASSGSLNSVTLTAEKGYVLAAGDYYIAVKAGDIENPTISYVYYNDDHTATEKTKAGSATLSFASDTNVKPISVDFTKGTVTTRKAVQLWKDGPYFAEYNVGASSATDVGSTMTFTNATAENFTWGPNWCTPSKSDMDHLKKAAKGETEDKVKCDYTQEGSTYGFKFTGLTDGYTGNSVFFPAKSDATINIGEAYYWSASLARTKAYSMQLKYNSGNWSSRWYESVKDTYYLVRPVLNNNGKIY